MFSVLQAVMILAHIVTNIITAMTITNIVTISICIFITSTFFYRLSIQLCNLLIHRKILLFLLCLEISFAYCFVPILRMLLCVFLKYLLIVLVLNPYLALNPLFYLVKFPQFSPPFFVIITQIFVVYIK